MKRWKIPIAGACLVAALLALSVGPARAAAGEVTTGADTPLFAPHIDLGPDNWAGYEVTGATFTDAEAFWNTQCQAGGEPSGATIGTWIGIGGEGNGALLQVGTVWRSGAYHLFTEWVYIGSDGQAHGGPVIRTTTFPCGVQIYAKVYKALDGSGHWCVLGNSGNDYVDSCGNWPPDQRNAEWIDERPLCTNDLRDNDPFAQLADFRYTQFSGVYALSNTGNHTLLGYPRHAVQQHDINGTVMVAPDAPSSATAFTDRWKSFDPGAHLSC